MRIEARPETKLAGRVSKVNLRRPTLRTTAKVEEVGSAMERHRLPVGMSSASVGRGEGRVTGINPRQTVITSAGSDRERTATSPNERFLPDPGQPSPRGNKRTYLCQAGR